MLKLLERRRSLLQALGPLPGTVFVSVRILRGYLILVRRMLEFHVPALAGVLDKLHGWSA
jgi:hypothetical protein